MPSWNSEEDNEMKLPPGTYNKVVVALMLSAVVGVAVCSMVHDTRRDRVLQHAITTQDPSRPDLVTEKAARSLVNHPEEWIVKDLGLQNSRHRIYIFTGTEDYEADETNARHLVLYVSGVEMPGYKIVSESIAPSPNQVRLYVSVQQWLAATHNGRKFGVELDQKKAAEHFLREPD